MTIVATANTDAKTLADAKFFYADELKLARDRAIRAMHEAEAAVDSLTRLETEVRDAHDGVKVERDAALNDAAKGLTEQMQSFYFGEGSS